MSALQGTHADGTSYTQKLTARTRDIKLWDDKLASVDLAPLSDLPALRKVFIRSSALRSLDLSPLTGSPIEELRLVLPAGLAVVLPSKCRALANLIISGGPSRVDLAPIAASPIRELHIYGGPLDEIDLGPLARCKALEYLWLKDNKLRTLDLTPLAKLPNLRALDLAGSRLTTLRAAPGFNALQFLHLHGNPLESLDLGAFRSIPTTMKIVNLPTSLLGTLDAPQRKGLDAKFTEDGVVAA